MFEWMPILSGAVLGLLHLRERITQRTLLCLAAIAAYVATASSGELPHAPQLILVDLALVATGVGVVRVIASYPSAGRSLRALHVLRDASASPVRQSHRNDPAP